MEPQRTTRVGKSARKRAALEIRTGCVRGPRQKLERIAGVVIPHQMKSASALGEKRQSSEGPAAEFPVSRMNNFHPPFS